MCVSTYLYLPIFPIYPPISPSYEPETMWTMVILVREKINENVRNERQTKRHSKNKEYHSTKKINKHIQIDVEKDTLCAGNLITVE